MIETLKKCGGYFEYVPLMLIGLIFATESELSGKLLDTGNGMRCTFRSFSLFRRFVSMCIDLFILRLQQIHRILKPFRKKNPSCELSLIGVLPE